MKKLLLLLLVMCSVSVNAQKLFSKEWKEKQLGKDSLSLAQKQEEQERKEINYLLKSKEKAGSHINTASEGFAMSGKLLQKSANLQYSAMACFAIGSGVAIAASYQDKVSDRNALLFAGGGLGLVGIVLQIKSVQYKMKSGKMLEYTGNKLTVTF